MSDPPDLATLARRYLDLWQEHLGSLARDPAVSDALARAFTLMTQGLADGGPARADDAGPRQPAAGEHATRDQAPGPTPGAPPNGGAPTGAAHPGGAAPGAAPAAPAPGHAGPADDELAARVEGLERRVALLEAALGGLLAGASRNRGGG